MGTICWEWTGYRTKSGYGQARVDGKVQYVHRAAYEAFFGPIPAGLEIDHMCRNRACYNPAHLRAVSHRDNLMAREDFGTETHCVRGHQRTINGRWCRRCHADDEQRRRDSRRAAA